MWKLLALVAVLFAYRLWVVRHSGISLFFDEAQYWDWSKHLAWGYFSKPPLIAGLIWLSTTLFGSGVLGVKALTMLLYPATALCMVGLARALWPTSSGVRTGMVAAALFMTIPMVGLMGMFASTDAPLILCWTLASWALWRAQVTNRMSHWVLLGVACGVGLMGKYTMAAFAITAIWTLWAVHGPQRGLWRPGPWVAMIVALALLSPNLMWNAANGFPTLQHTVELTAQSDRSGGVLPTLVFLAGQVLMLGPVAVIAGIWLYKRQPTPGTSMPGNTAPTSQWAASSQMMPPSQWKNSTQATMPSQPGGQGEQAAKRPVVRNSAYYLASVSSYRFLWAMSIPLQAIAIVQALYADAHVNWAAPSMVGFTLLIASRLSAPLVPLAAPRPATWLIAVLASNLILTSITLHLRDVVGPTLSSKYDVLVRMRGWQEAFADLAPELEDPVVTGLPVLTDSRLFITEAAYHWRRYNVQTLAWNPNQQRQDHYQMTRSLPNKVGADVLLLTSNPKPAEITKRFAIIRHMKSTSIAVGPDRNVDMHLFFLRGFLGYDQKTYLEQSGADKPSTTDDQ
ncbi:MAG: glycosyltransferase family 39 protein [Aquabacterium sp.]|nr:glycosyltransferase family 39 protein [Aquabacterium sp.]